MTERVTDQSTRWLDQGQQRSWRSYIMGSTLLMDRLDRELRQNHGLSMPEYEVLVRLSESDCRSLRMAVLADAVSYSRSRITHTVTRLERMGLVARTAADEDRRGVAAVLTDKGYAALEAAAHTHVRGVREHLVDLASDEDLEAVGRVFDAVCDHLLAGASPEVDIR
jgi:DNA-binding MarR family transcriptional regulator